MMNREQRRKYQKSIKRNPAACICPKCNNLSLFMTKAVKDQEMSIVCETCGEIVMQNEDITKSLPAGVYLPWKLTDLNVVFGVMKAMRKEKVNEE